MYDHMQAVDFTVGDRVELHPSHNLWMRGARFGTVTAVGKSIIQVELDNLHVGRHGARAVRSFAPINLRII